MYIRTVAPDDPVPAHPQYDLTNDPTCPSMQVSCSLASALTLEVCCCADRL